MRRPVPKRRGQGSRETRPTVTTLRTGDTVVMTYDRTAYAAFIQDEEAFGRLGITLIPLTRGVHSIVAVHRPDQVAVSAE